jgi:lysyl-tRNA synthetase class I
MKKLLFVLVFVLVNTVAYAQEAYIELLRSDVKTRKVAIITKVMQFTDEEANAFWPVHREYEFELTKLGDAKLELIKDYAQNYETMTDEKAEELIKAVFKLEGKRTKLKKKYFKKFDKVLPSKTVAKFFQLENQILLLIDLQIASQLPLIK